MIEINPIRFGLFEKRETQRNYEYSSIQSERKTLAEHTAEANAKGLVVGAFRDYFHAILLEQDNYYGLHPFDTKEIMDAKTTARHKNLDDIQLNDKDFRNSGVIMADVIEYFPNTQEVVITSYPGSTVVKPYQRRVVLPNWTKYNGVRFKDAIKTEEGYKFFRAFADVPDNREKLIERIKQFALVEISFWETPHPIYPHSELELRSLHTRYRGGRNRNKYIVHFNNCYHSPSLDLAYRKRSWDIANFVKYE